MVFVKRLGAVRPDLTVRETAVPQALARFCRDSGIDLLAAAAYRQFEDGRSHRQTILDGLSAAGLLEVEGAIKMAAVQSVEAFHAVMAGLVAACFHHGLVSARPEGFDEQGWVFLPEMTGETEQLVKAKQTN
jgi:hypothetical protein